MMSIKMLTSASRREMDMMTGHKVFPSEDLIGRPLRWEDGVKSHSLLWVYKCRGKDGDGGTPVLT